MVRSTALFFGLSLLAASVDAGSHITGHSPSRRMSALKKRGLVVRNNHLGPEPASHEAAAKAEEDCIQQCKAKGGLGEPAAAAPAEGGAEGKNNADAGAAAAAGGKVKKVVVAPEQGVLRFVPFNINVKAGETIRYEWGGGPHTVVKASAFSLCNKTEDGTAFASDKLEAGGTFDLLVNDTNPINFYCSVETHCLAGMFGTVNGASATASSSLQASALISSVASSSPSIQTLLDETNKMAEGTDAKSWGETLDVSAYPEWAHKSVVENVLATRQFYAKNLAQLAFDMDQTDEAPTPAAADDASAPEPTTSGVTVVDSSTGASSGSYGAGYGGSDDAAAESDNLETDTSGAVVARHAPWGALLLAGLAMMA